MTDLSNIAQTVINTLKDTVEYKEYEEALAELTKDPALYKRVNEMRDKNFSLQQYDGDDILDLMDALTNEYEDVINLEITGRFIEAEADVCTLIRNFTHMVTEGLDFDI